MFLQIEILILTFEKKFCNLQFEEKKAELQVGSDLLINGKEKKLDGFDEDINSFSAKDYPF